MKRSWEVATLTIVLLCGATVLSYAASVGKENPELPGEYTVIGTVQEARANQLKVDIGEVQPRFLPMNPAKEKGFEKIKPGEKILVTLNEQNLIIDYHRLGESGHHHILRGKLADPLVVGHDQAVIRTEDGKTEQYAVQSQARSKLAGVSVGVEADFLLDEANQIADVVFASKEAAARAGSGAQKPPRLNAQRRVEGTVVSPLSENRIRVRTTDGKEGAYEVHQPVQEKLSKVSKGQSVVLMLDSDDKVMDVAFLPQG